MKIKLNHEFQFYKGIMLQLTKREYTRYNAKQFTLNNTIQKVWIPNKHLLEDGTINPKHDIDYVFRSAQKQLEYAGYTGPIPGIRRSIRGNAVYVSELSQLEQRAILSPIAAKLKEEGLPRSDLFKALDDARNSKIRDIEIF